MAINNGSGIGYNGIAFPGGGGGSTPTIQNVTFGANGSLDGLGNDTFGNSYVLYNSGPSTTDEPAFIRGMQGDVLNKISIAVGGSTSGTVTVGLYSADSISGPWTLEQKYDIAAAPTGYNIIASSNVNFTFTKGKYYFLAVNSATVNLVQAELAGGLKRWVAAAGVMPATLADADSSTSNYIVYCFGTVARNVGPKQFSPLDLFAQGALGAWYDPSDLTTLFQDRARTIPVTAVGQNVGGILDKSGNGLHLSGEGTLPTYQIVDGKPVIRFIGTGSYSASSAPMYASGKKFMVSAALKDTFGTSQYDKRIFAERARSVNNPFYALIANPQSPTGNPKGSVAMVRDGSGTIVINNNAVIASDMFLGQKNVIHAVDLITEIRHYSRQILKGSVSYSRPSLSVDAMCVCGLPTTAHFTGDLYGYVIYSGDDVLDKIDPVNAWLGERM